MLSSSPRGLQHVLHTTAVFLVLINAGCFWPCRGFTPISAGRDTRLNGWDDLLRTYTSDRHLVNGLIEAGECVACAENADGRLVQFGESLTRAGLAWTNDWSEVTEHMAQAGEICREIGSDLDIKKEQQDRFKQLADQLEDASSIEGCTSIGPPSAVPNLEEISTLFEELAANEPDSGISAAFTNARLAIERLIEEI